MKSLKGQLMALLVVLFSMTLVIPSMALAKKDENACPGNSCDAPGQTDQSSKENSGAPGQLIKLSKGNSDLKGNLKTKQHIYYEGDSLEVSVKFSRGLDLLADGTVATHIVVITPEADLFSVPVESTIGGNERMFFDIVVTTETLPVGQYQVALIATIPAGDPANLQHWYNGFRGLLDMEGIYISDEPLPEDANSDGECDYDADGDGFCDEEGLEDNDDGVDDDAVTP